MTFELALILAVIGAVVAWKVMEAVLRPRVAVTVQKTTNTNQQPEVVTVQASLWRLGNPDKLFRVICDAADGAWARMYYVNKRIIERQDEIAAEIDRRKTLEPAWEERVTKRERRMIAAALGVPLKDVTREMVLAERAKAAATEERALEPVG